MRRVGKVATNAELVTDVGRRLIELAAVEPGMEVLDVACGAGNAAIPAAQAGARTTGVDPWVDMLALARERAADYMVEVEWVDADAGELPFPDSSFDRVVSVFGPDDRLATSEMRRVCRPGGAIAVATWGTESSVAESVSIERGQLDWNGRAREYVLTVLPR